MTLIFLSILLIILHAFNKKIIANVIKRNILDNIRI